MPVFSLVGGSGYIGQSLFNALNLAGHDVRIIRRNEFPDKGKNCGHVIYCAGITRGEFKSRWREIVEAHVSYLSTVLSIITCDSFLYLSSARVYENNQTTHERSEIFCDPLGESNFYNLSKLLGEGVVMNSGISAPRIARLSYVVDGLSDQFFSPLVRSSRSGSITIKGHPDTVKDFLLLEDALGILTKIAIDGNSEIYNVSSGVNLSLKQVGSLLDRHLKCGVVFEQGWQKRSPLPIDNIKIRDEFGLRPRSVISELEKIFARGVTHD